jgi:hypothetical protein
MDSTQGQHLRLLVGFEARTQVSHDATPSGVINKRLTSEQVLVIVGRAKRVWKQRLVWLLQQKKAMLALQVSLALD